MQVFDYKIGHKNLDITSSYNFDATKLFFIYFVIYSFNNGIFKKVFCNRGILIIWGFFSSPWSNGEKAVLVFFFLFRFLCFRHNNSKWNSVFIII